MGPAGLGSPRCWCHSRWLLGLSLPKGGTRPPGVVGGRARATSRVLTPRVAVSPCLLWPRIACACPVPILRWPRSHVPMVSCPRGPCVRPSLCQCPPSALVLIFRFCPEGGSFLMVPRVTIVPVILMSPGPHRAHPRGSCVPKFPQSPFLMVPIVLSVPACPRGISVSPQYRYSPCPFVPTVPLPHSVHFPSVPTAFPHVPTVSPHCPPVSPGGAGAVPARGRGGGGADETERRAGAGAGGAPGPAAEPCPEPATGGGTAGTGRDTRRWGSDIRGDIWNSCRAGSGPGDTHTRRWPRSCGTGCNSRDTRTGGTGSGPLWGHVNLGTQGPGDTAEA